MHRILIIALVFSISSLYGQDQSSEKQHFASLKTQFFQFKDEFNYGAVFSGLNLVGEYEYRVSNADRLLSYTPELGFGMLYGVGAGLAWRLQPLDIYYGIKPASDGLLKDIGPYVAANYHWQLYPELQSGHMFWFSTIEIGPQMTIEFDLKQKPMWLSVSNSVLGFSSRPLPHTESHFYNLQLSEFVQNAHRNMGFGSFNHFSRTHLELGLVRSEPRKMQLTYEFEMIIQTWQTKVSYLSHSINFNWRIGKS